ncbi:MAG: alpha/beta fold hydrolase [Bacteroidales bacterium]|nr:alpha/beta fold hydrolase [Bacteroidales bacterium]
MKSKLLFLLFLIFSLTSCSFDKMFLIPDKIEPEHTQKIIIRQAERIELDVNFSGTNYQPIISKDNMPFDLGYQIESVLFESTSGNILNGWLMKPTEPTETKAGILFLHGNAGSILNHFTLAHPLVKKGFQVFLFDYSGFGLSEGKATRKNVLKDAQSALDYIISRNEFKNLPLVIYGQSLGGNLAAVLGSRNRDKADAMVIEGAFSSHDDVAAHVTGLGFIARLFVREMYASEKAIKIWEKPLLVIHSTEDATVPYFMGETIFNNACEPKSFYAIDKPHICGPIYYTDSISNKIIKMINQDFLNR